MPTDRELIETRHIECPDGIGAYLSEGAEVTVWQNTIDPDYVIKVQKRDLTGYQATDVPQVNRARWSRKMILYDTFLRSPTLIQVAATFFVNEGVLWQEYTGITVAEFIARHADTWQRIASNFHSQVRIWQQAAQRRMEIAFSSTQREMPDTCGDGVANLRAVDAHLYNFTIRVPEAETADEVTLENVYLIDW